MKLDLKTAVVVILGAAALIPAALLPVAVSAAPSTSAKAAPAAPAAKGREVFASYGCGGCHTLAAAGASGQAGPSLDGNANLSADYIQDRVSSGSGIMPSFADQLSAAEIHALAGYIMSVKGK